MKIQHDTQFYGVMCLERSYELNLREIGPSAAVSRFFSKYGKMSTKAAYSDHLKLSFRWLRQEKGLKESPDELVKDNLVCIFKSDPTDVLTKRKHTDRLNEYVNDYLLKRGLSESRRNCSGTLRSPKRRWSLHRNHSRLRTFGSC
jgi:hypothetical protein